MGCAATCRKRQAALDLFALGAAFGRGERLQILAVGVLRVGDVLVFN